MSERPKPKLIYCATPSRMVSSTKQIMNFVTAQRDAPFHPLHAFEYSRFEGGPVGREGTLEFCCRAIQLCDEFWLFGVSAGTLFELDFTVEFNRKNPQLQKTIRLLHRDFDPDWEEFATGHMDLLRL